MGQYRLSARFLVQSRWRLLLNSIWVIPIAGLLVWRMPIAIPRAMLIALMSVLVVAAFALGLRQVRRVRDSYLISVEPDGVRRAVDGLSDLAIAAADIATIVERPGAGLTVHGPPGRSIWVPAELEGYAQARAELAALHPVETPAPSWWQPNALGQLFSVTFLSALAGFYLFEDHRIVAISGGVLFAGLILGLVVLQRNPHVPPRTKRLSWLCLLPLLSIVHKTVVAIASWR